MWPFRAAIRSGLSRIRCDPFVPETSLSLSRAPSDAALWSIQAPVAWTMTLAVTGNRCPVSLSVRTSPSASLARCDVVQRQGIGIARLGIADQFDSQPFGMRYPGIVIGRRKADVLSQRGPGRPRRRPAPKTVPRQHPVASGDRVVKHQPQLDRDGTARARPSGEAQKAEGRIGRGPRSRDQSESSSAGAAPDAAHCATTGPARSGFRGPAQFRRFPDSAIRRGSSATAPQNSPSRSRSSRPEGHAGPAGKGHERRRCR